MALYIVIMASLVMMSAYFSATETAFSSLNKTRIKTLAEKGNKKAKLVCRLVDNYDKLISTILIGNNIVNISLSSLATVFFVRYFKEYGAMISTVVITVIVLIFGEISPKSVAKDCPERFAIFSAPIINVIVAVFTPINFLFSLWKKGLSKMLKLETNQKMSQEELLMFVNEVEQEGSIDNSSGDLLRNAIEFTELEAEDILTHRVDLEAFPIDTEKEEIAKIFSRTKFSRLLIYEENIDNIVGVIHQKDFYIDGHITDEALKDIITKPLFITKNEKINSILKLLQKEKSHIAVVLDEFGGTLGIVTMEDILEELVGEIWDEHDEVVEGFKLVAVNTYRVDCSIDTDEFFEFFNISNEETENPYLSGWIMEKLEKVPEKGDKFTFNDMDITVISTDLHRADQIEVFCKNDVNQTQEELEMV